MVVDVTGFRPTWEKHNHAAPTTDADTRALRLKDGQCPTCGAQTHEIKTRGIVRRSQTKVPLTEAGETQRGRCLLCHPVQPPAQTGGAASGSSPFLLRSFLSGSSGPSSLPTLPPKQTPLPPPKPNGSKENKKQQFSSSLGNERELTKEKTTTKATSSPSRKSTANFAYVRSASERTITSILDYNSCGSCTDIEWKSKKQQGWKFNKWAGQRRPVRWPKIG